MVERSGRGRRIGLYAIITLSVPLSLALETTMRRVFFPPEFELLREMLAPTIEAWSTTLIAACVLLGLVGAVVVTRVSAALAREREALPLEAYPAFERRLDDRLLVLTSIPQVPAVAATFSVMLGGPFTPAFVCMGVSSAAILTQAVIIERTLGRAGPSAASIA